MYKTYDVCNLHNQSPKISYSHHTIIPKISLTRHTTYTQHISYSILSRFLGMCVLSFLSSYFFSLPFLSLCFSYTLSSPSLSYLMFVCMYVCISHCLSSFFSDSPPLVILPIPSFRVPFIFLFVSQSNYLPPLHFFPLSSIHFLSFLLFSYLPILLHALMFCSFFLSSFNPPSLTTILSFPPHRLSHFSVAIPHSLSLSLEPLYFYSLVFLSLLIYHCFS